MLKKVAAQITVNLEVEIGPPLRICKHEGTFFPPESDAGGGGGTASHVMIFQFQGRG